MKKSLVGGHWLALAGKFNYLFVVENYGTN